MRRDGTPLSVAVVDEELPYPLDSGKRIRTWSLLTRLANRHRITYFCHESRAPDEEATARQKLIEAGIESVVVRRRPPPDSHKPLNPRFLTRVALNLASRLPYSVQSHTSLPLRAAVARHARDGRPDLWHCEWTPCAETLRGLPDLRYVAMAHNVESLIWQRYHQTERHPFRRWYIARQWARFRDFERWVFSDAQRIVAVSDHDAALARNEFGASRVSVVENGVDLEQYPPRPAEEKGEGILFLGSLDWRPNLDGVALLMNEVFPRVRAQRSDASLTIVGRRPPDWLVRQAGQAAGVRLCADVPDVRPYLAGSAVMVVPLRIGGGTRLKILEAAASAVPVVSTAVGAEGLCIEPERHFLQGETAEELASRLVQCLAHPESAAEMARRARAEVVERYDWNRLADKLEEVWLACASGMGRTAGQDQ